MTCRNEVMPNPGQPDGWNERHKSELTGIVLPDGAEFYSTPSHGYLRVDFNKLSAKVSAYDYMTEPHHALLEEDCSATMWMAEQGLIPMADYIMNMIVSTPRTSAYGLMHPGQTVIEPGLTRTIDGQLIRVTQRIIAGRPHEPPIITKLAEAIIATTCQCCSCEHVFTEVQLDAGGCPKCLSGNWVRGYIDGPEPLEC